ncbi:hypothetical protein YC2023_059233 [Brassica napus]
MHLVLQNGIVRKYTTLHDPNLEYLSTNAKDMPPCHQLGAKECDTCPLKLNAEFHLFWCPFHLGFSVYSGLMKPNPDKE